jgi:diacylglycerol kinase (ATP)
VSPEAEVGDRISEFLVILNPAADRGRAKHHAPILERAFRRAGVEAKVRLTRGHGHAVELAEQAAHDGWPAVVAVGGDGIVHEVANGLMRAAGEQPTIPLGVIPAGSGNDFAKMIGAYGTRPTEAAERLCSAVPRRVDIGRVTRWSAETAYPAVWHFTNGIGLGFDAQVGVRASRIKHLHGMMIYAVALLQVLRQLRTPSMRVVLDGREIADRPLVVTTVSNGACHGGSFWLCPHAIVDDGLFDVLIADARSVWDLTRLIPSVMRGTHLGAWGVELHRGQRVSVASDEPLPIHADGEIVGHAVREIEMQILPGRLTVLGPPSDVNRSSPHS